MKVRLRLITARRNFQMISHNPNVSFGINESSLYTRGNVFKDNWQKRGMDMLAYTPVEYNYLGTLAKMFIIPATQNQFLLEKFSNIAPVCRIANARN